MCGCQGISVTAVVIGVICGGVVGSVVVVGGVIGSVVVVGGVVGSVMVVGGVCEIGGSGGQRGHQGLVRGE